MRIAFVALLLAGAACSRGSSPSPASAPGVATIRSDLNRDEQIDHALNRLSYGPRPGDAQRVRSMGLERWIAAQLAPESIDDRRADSLLGRYATLGLATADLTAAQRQIRVARQQGDTARLMAQQNIDLRTLNLAVVEVASAKLTRAVASERQLYEQMVDFWENHFSVFAGKGQTRLFVPAYDRDVIRPLAMGKFRDLLGAVAKSPAMLFYLDNAQSVADSSHRTLAEVRRGNVVARQRPRRGLNENYARELMELHTLGVDGGYAQQDVIEVARALTGWGIDPQSGAFVFRPAAHDADKKIVLGRHLMANRGIEDGEEVLDILASHPSTARFITTKMVVRFVSDSAPQALVERCAAVFRRSEGDIRRTLQCVVTSPEFFSRAAYRAKVKTPFELVASALRATDAAPDDTPRSAQIVARLGQPIFGRQTPDGWPDVGGEWMNAGAMMNRVNFAIALAERRLPGVRVGPVGDAVAQRLASPDFQRR